MKTGELEKEIVVCECGCGNPVRLEFHRFINGHNAKLKKGKRLSEEHKKRLSESHKGKVTWQKGLIKETDKRVLKISEAKMGNKLSEEHKEKLRRARRKRVITEKTKKQTSETWKEKWEDSKFKEYMLSCRNMSGVNNPFYNKKHKKETLQRISELSKERWSCPESRKKMMESRDYSKISGPNSIHWQGGISNEPYCDAWADREYKQDILERDNYQCQNLDCWERSKRLMPHHIDYDKKNCHPDNLITLCGSCNVRANFNRDYWQKFYGGLSVC